MPPQTSLGMAGKTVAGNVADSHQCGRQVAGKHVLVARKRVWVADRWQAGGGQMHIAVGRCA